MRRGEGGRSSDKVLNEITAYYYVMTAVDAVGNESVFSTEASAMTPSNSGGMRVLKMPDGSQTCPYPTPPAP